MPASRSNSRSRSNANATVTRRAVRKPGIKDDRPASPVKRSRSRSPAKPRPLSVIQIHDRVLAAISEQRLRPGTQLVEEKLATLFGVSRTKVRQAITRLAQDGIVTMIHNRGAFVTRPTKEQAREVFEARRLIEPWLVRALAAQATPEQIARLRAHVELESRARADNDPRAIIRLSGEFHLLIADMAGNTVLARTMREIESMTSLVIVMYDSPGVPTCPFQEHAALIKAIARGDADGAAAMMIEHLNHVEAELDLDPEPSPEIELESAFL